MNEFGGSGNETTCRVGFDLVKKPAHYTEGRDFEPLDVIEDWKLGFHLGNALKYIARCGRKDNNVQDIKKAIEYLRRYCEFLEKEE